MAMHNLVLLKAELQKTQAANKKVLKKRQKKKSYISKGGVLRAREVQEAQRSLISEVEQGSREVKQIAPPLITRAPRTCSLCRSLEHTARTCSKRQ
jgi:hypothetical protein